MPSRQWFLIALALLSANACRWPDNPAAHAQIPAHPKRIVTVAPQIFEDVVALGVLPVGSYLLPADRPLMSPHDWNSIARLSTPPDIEQILSLHPDLIFTVGHNQIASLGRIGPVVDVKNFTNFSDWRVRYRYVAGILGRGPEAEAAIADTDRKLTEVRHHFEGHPFRILMGHVSSTTRSMVIFPGNQNTAHLMNAIGLTYGFLQHRKLADTYGTNISWETVDDLQCDAFFVTPAAFESPDDLQGTAAQLALLQRQPLWNRLPFVKNGRVFYMHSYWQMVTPVNADRILEDLERDLLGRDLDREWKLHLPVTISRQ